MGGHVAGVHQLPAVETLASQPFAQFDEEPARFGGEPERQRVVVLHEEPAAAQRLSGLYLMRCGWSAAEPSSL